MMYSTTKETLKRSLPGFAMDIQCNDPDDIEYVTIKEKVSK